jgi:flagellar protein FlaF
MSLPPSLSSSHHAPAASADPRLIEGWALSETAQRLTAACREPVDAAALLDAVRLNWRLWTIFQASLFDPDCPLPDELRDNLLSLASFIDKHSAGIVAEPDPGKLDVLIRINQELAGGLTVPGSSPSER